ncbi:MAG: MlaE family ABC transporter permease [bacterium]|jgi:phospholipid/cholesterol/gamma-HCH transport system permease protein
MNVLFFLEYIGIIYFIFKDLIKSIFKLDFPFEYIPYYIVHLGYNALFIVVLTITFSGMVISLELAKEAVRYGVGDMVGGGVAVAMAREFGPMLSAIVIIGRSGAAIAAEIATMNATDQIDALKTMGANIYSYLITPRLIALLISQPIITLISVISGTAGGYFMANIYAGISYKVYTSSIERFLEPYDIFAGILKSMVFAITIVLICSIEGIKSEKNSAGVGVATTKAVMYSIIMIFILNFILSYLLFGK